MTLPQEPVFSLLKDHFVVGWDNIAGEDYVGASHGYTCEESAVGTTNGAGPRNTQMFILSPDGIVLHCLPGFWHPDDLAFELEFARVMARLWQDKRSKQDKRALFVRMHQRAIRTAPKAMVVRSAWQGFDANHERERLEQGPRDTFYYDQDGEPAGLKPLNVLLHERMAARPFVAFKNFDTATFVDYGRPYYDNNAHIDGIGVTFGTEGYMDSQKRMAERAKKRAEVKRRAAEYEGKKPQTEKLKTRRKPKQKKSTSRPTGKK